MHARPRDSVAFTVLVTLLTLIGAVIVGVVVLLSGAPTSLLIATILAAVPVGPLVGCYLWLDRYEPEPRSLLIAGLAWGAFAATGGALLLQVVGTLGDLTRGETATVLAPITEEATKGIFLLMLLWWRRHELDGVLDGIVYAGMIGIGFAFTENIIYLAAAYEGFSGPGDALGPGGADALTGTFILRCLVSPFAHPAFTAFTGIGVGIAVSTRRRTIRVLAPIAGYAAAVIAHAVWNSAAMGSLSHFLLVYGLMMLPVFWMIAAFAIFRRSSERPMLQAALEDAARRGLVPADDVAWLVDLRARRRARVWAGRQGGRLGVRAMREYQSVAIELAYLHHRYLRGTPPDDFVARGEAYVARINAVRPLISFPGQVVPTP